MRWQSFAVYAVLVIAWVAFGVWQYRSCVRERQLIEETLHQQSHSVMAALVGGMQSHRRLGRFLELQLQGMLEELVKSPDVIAVSILSGPEKTILSAGAVEQLDLRSGLPPGDHWTSAGFQLTEPFVLQPPEAGSEPVGGGRGGGGGRGYGLRWRTDAADEDSVLGEGGRFFAALLLDRTRADQLNRRSVWSHVFVTGAGGLVLLCLALVWRAGVRMLEAQGRARLLEVETRHLRELSQAAAGLAHETRNPLGLIRGWTQRLLEDETDDPDRAEHVRAVMEECDRVTARINQFLAFARPCAPAIGPVDPSRIVAELGMILQPDLEAKRLTLAMTGATSAKPVQADRELLRQALFNLIQNAVAFAPGGDTITISVVDEPGGRCRLEVADRGPGVPPESVPLLFTPYHTTRPGGTGLGLAIVRRIASAHGWEAAYRPGSDGGAVFSLQGIHV
ncbi:MAG TPA: ATP-binding protein [Candidatus Anammoximicrobium sp.]|nr:ATP-binding protein [Candidatus Anammoximicrobium sp.]